MGACCSAPQNSRQSSGQTTTASLNDETSANKSNPGTATLASLGSEKKDKDAFTRRTSAHHGIMGQIAMKFPKIRRSFRGCQEVFQKHAGAEESVNKAEIKPILVDLGARESDLTEEAMNKILETCNLDGDDKIDFKEFLIAAAVGVFLNNIESQDFEPQFLEIREGFMVCKDAFNKIDKDGGGSIDFEELKAAFLSMREDELILERLKELDFDGNHEIEFPEFVFGLCAWVGMDPDDLDDVGYAETLSPQMNNPQFDAKEEAETPVVLAGATDS